MTSPEENCFCQVGWSGLPDKLNQGLPDWVQEVLKIIWLGEWGKVTHFYGEAMSCRKGILGTLDDRKDILENA